jgi:hypothetical protein
VPDRALDMSGLMYVALTRCKEFSQINLHGKLTKEHFEYRHDFDIDRVIANTQKVMQPA